MCGHLVLFIFVTFIGVTLVNRVTKVPSYTSMVHDLHIGEACQAREGGVRKESPRH